jgi:hypothetical protein
MGNFETRNAAGNSIQDKKNPNIKQLNPKSQETYGILQINLQKSALNG